MKRICRAIRIENSFELKELYKSIMKEYHIDTVVDEKHIIISTDKTSNILKEWISISSFLWKNSLSKLRMVKIDYPFTIHENESPDFIVSTPKRDYRIEVTRCISQNMARLYELSKILNKRINYINKAILFNDDTILSDDLLKEYLMDKDIDYSYMGWPEINPWVNLLHYRIKKKSQKKYRMDVLLIDDHHLITGTSDSNTLERAIHFLLDELKKRPIVINNINKIIIDNPIGFLQLHKKQIWQYNLKTSPYLFDELDD